MQIKNDPYLVQPSFNESMSVVLLLGSREPRAGQGQEHRDLAVKRTYPDAAQAYLVPCRRAATKGRS